MIALLLAAALTITGPAIAIDEDRLQPAGDTGWDAVYTHAELAEARAAGGLTVELRALIDQRLSAPPVAASATAARSGSRWGGGAGVEQWRPLVASYGGWNVNIMLCLMAAESGGNPNAVNPTSGAAGLFQVMPFWWDHYGGNPFDPATNVAVAHAIWGQQGYGAWSPYNRGACH